jgi:hypothetical protein
MYCKATFPLFKKVPYKRKVINNSSTVSTYLSTSSSSAGATFSPKVSHENIRILISFLREEKKLYTASFYTCQSIGMLFYLLEAISFTRIFIILLKYFSFTKLAVEVYCSNA